MKAALVTVASTLRRMHPDEIVSITAFGSRVRGDHAEGSDFDVLVIVKNRTISLEEAIIEAFVDEELKSGFFFDPVIKTERSFELEERHRTPFYQNIRREGVPV